MVPQQSSFANPAPLACFSAALLIMAESDGKGMEVTILAASQDKKGMQVLYSLWPLF